MKKILALMMVFACVFCWSFACAEGLDFAAMSDEQLKEIIDGARNELAKRELILAEKTVLFEQDGVSAYLTGEYEIQEYDDVYLSLEVVVINDSNKTVWISTDPVSVNGWNVFAYGISETSAGKKQKANLEFCISDAEITTFEEVEEIEFVFELVDEDTSMVFSTTEPITIHF